MYFRTSSSGVSSEKRIGTGCSSAAMMRIRGHDAVGRCRVSAQAARKQGADGAQQIVGWKMGPVHRAQGMAQSQGHVGRAEKGGPEPDLAALSVTACGTEDGDHEQVARREERPPAQNPCADVDASEPRKLMSEQPASQRTAGQSHHRRADSAAGCVWVSSFSARFVGPPKKVAARRLPSRAASNAQRQ